jgi:hypothetical protein
MEMLWLGASLDNYLVPAQSCIIIRQLQCSNEAWNYAVSGLK